MITQEIFDLCIMHPDYISYTDDKDYNEETGLIENTGVLIGFHALKTYKQVKALFDSLQNNESALDCVLANIIFLDDTSIVTFSLDFSGMCYFYSDAYKDDDEWFEMDNICPWDEDNFNKLKYLLDTSNENTFEDNIRRIAWEYFVENILNNC